ncbi:hypothetical protein HHK36_020226 [Tetracentron sinense]|uniref:Uncharacterized protein n=1 Tax=Tetracentron sinense TaxID=13715 RepID=A0A835DBF5_TETSI|nr:hypothetical protein HHK36_020226 [Tetracentron sinense]
MNAVSTSGAIGSAASANAVGKALDKSSIPYDDKWGSCKCTVTMTTTDSHFSIFPFLKFSSRSAGRRQKHDLWPKTIIGWTGAVTGADVVHEPTDMDLAMKIHYLRGVYFFNNTAVQVRTTRVKDTGSKSNNSNSHSRRNGKLSNNQIISVVKADFSVVESDPKELAALVVEQTMDEKSQIEEEVEKGQGLSDFIMYGSNLTL